MTLHTFIEIDPYAPYTVDWWSPLNYSPDIDACHIDAFRHGSLRGRELDSYGIKCVRLKLLLHIVQAQSLGESLLLFCRTSLECEAIGRQLRTLCMRRSHVKWANRNGEPRDKDESAPSRRTHTLGHFDLPKEKLSRNINAFFSQKVKCLVCTDSVLPLLSSYEGSRPKFLLIHTSLPYSLAQYNGRLHAVRNTKESLCLVSTKFVEKVDASAVKPSCISTSAQDKDSCALSPSNSTKSVEVETLDSTTFSWVNEANLFIEFQQEVCFTNITSQYDFCRSAPTVDALLEGSRERKFKPTFKLSEPTDKDNLIELFMRRSQRFYFSVIESLSIGPETIV